MEITFEMICPKCGGKEFLSNNLEEGEFKVSKNKIESIRNDICLNCGEEVENKIVMRV